ncbi:MAG: hypothetical protein QNJ58_07460 [Desulfobacterales bacterium]|nr:hypothetical protein [Desulfobacterales bacterium]
MTTWLNQLPRAETGPLYGRFDGSSAYDLRRPWSLIDAKIITGEVFPSRCLAASPLPPDPARLPRDDEKTSQEVCPSNQQKKKR